MLTGDATSKTTRGSDLLSTDSKLATSDLTDSNLATSTTGDPSRRLRIA